MDEIKFQLYVMVHDNPSARLAREFESAGALPIELNVPFMNRKREITKKIAKVFEKKLNKKIPLVIYGSGNCHHYTYGLCKSLADRRTPDYSYVHIDDHTDFGAENDFEPEEKTLACGDFVAHILADTNAQPSIHIGQDFMCRRKNLPIKKRSSIKNLMFAMYLRNGEKKYRKLRNMFSEMKGQVYVSIDLDVLKKEHITTDYGNGYLGLEDLVNIIKKIKYYREIIGFDICGLNSRYTSDSDIQTHRTLVENIIGVKT
jgi:arginase family enzyme